MVRKIVSFAITSSYLDQSMFGFEQKEWAKATGEKHATARDLTEWCTAHGKTIVEKGWKPKSNEQLFDEEMDRDLGKSLDKHYEDRHNLGTV